MGSRHRFDGITTARLWLFPRRCPAIQQGDMSKYWILDFYRIHSSPFPLTQILRSIWQTDRGLDCSSEQVIVTGEFFRKPAFGPITHNIFQPYGLHAPTVMNFRSRAQLTFQE